jgi:hypothetical protein
MKTSLLVRRRLLGGGFSPQTLFALSEPGFWYDPSDLTTLFKDTAGTQPVTTPGDTVALMLDKRQGLVLGPELSANLSGYTTIRGGGALVSPAVFSSSGAGGVENSTILTVGRGYKIQISYTKTNNTSEFSVNNAAGVRLNTLAFSTASSGTFSITTVAVSPELYFRLNATDTVTISNISVRELPGFHATQSTTANRPTYGIVPKTGRRNLLTRTEDFSNAAWTKLEVSLTADAAVAPDGTSTADLLSESNLAAVHAINQSLSYVSGTAYTISAYLKKGSGATAPDWVQVTFGSAAFGASQYANFNLTTGLVGTVVGGNAAIQSVGSGWYRVSFTATATSTASAPSGIVFNNNSDSSGRVPSYTGATTSNVLAWGAQLELGSTATAYQRVTTQFDVTEAGVASDHYLFFGGSTDPRWMVTPTITPGTDKVQVFAGVRKLSDAAAGVILETSTNYGANDGSLLMLAPDTALSGYRFGSSGSIRLSNAIVSGFAAPHSAVLTGLGDISGDRTTLRVIGIQVGQNTADQGTGNYLAYLAYIGARAGSSLYLNGQIFQLITRFGPNLPTPTIQQTERFVAEKTSEVTL